MSPQRFTFHTILAGCERADAAAWREFLIAYSPVASWLLEVYFPCFDGPVRWQLWGEIVQTLAADGCARLRQLNHQAEREFLIDLQRLLLEHAGARLDSEGPVTSDPRPTFEFLHELLPRLPLA